ncbi:cytochrome P450 [Gloeopeniophorella convolvens]|nr:cytochrome P450 [Gloeopeniophorella convolvens]
MNTVTVYVGFAVAAGLLVAFVITKAGRSLKRLPPGPVGLPWIGNIFDMPTSREWETFGAWGKRWGGIMHITLFGQHFIIVNSLEIAISMLEGKSAIYSDRPTFPMLGQTMGWENGTALSRYGERFRALRRLLHQTMGTRTSAMQHYPIIEKETLRFLQRLLDSPGQLMENLRKTVVATIVDVAYGYKVHEFDDPLVHVAQLTNAQFARAATPGAFMVDLVPFLRCVPDWFPGTGWKKLGREWGSNVRVMVDTPFEHVKRRRAAGISALSFMDHNTKDGMSTQEEDLVKWAAASIYMGGTDTTISTLYTFFLAMTLYPDVQKKAQAELDSVVGSERLPTFEDREQLPYINAIVKEILRWGPATPLAGHHRLMQDDFQDGYFVPEGSAVIVNVWGLLHDESIYKDPMTFNPERFTSSEKRPAEIDPQICFGFGRR